MKFYHTFSTAAAVLECCFAWRLANDKTAVKHCCAPILAENPLHTDATHSQFRTHSSPHCGIPYIVANLGRDSDAKWPCHATRPP